MGGPRVAHHTVEGAWSQEETRAYVRIDRDQDQATENGTGGLGWVRTKWPARRVAHGPLGSDAIAGAVPWLRPPLASGGTSEASDRCRSRLLDQAGDRFGCRTRPWSG